MKKIKLYGRGGFSEDTDLLYAFTGKESGFSQGACRGLNLALHVGDDPEKVMKNRLLLAEELDFNLQALSWADQVHGDQIFLLKKKEEAGFLGSFDAIITDLPGVPLMTMFADCIPILLFDHKKRVIASVHAGWKGTYLEIAGKTVRKMIEEYASNPKDIQAMIGPGICKEHYTVGEDLIEKFQEKFPQLIVKNDSNLDLKEINRSILKKAGLEKIVDLKLCTVCQKEKFFSYRLDAGKTGRIAAIIMLR